MARAERRGLLALPAIVLVTACSGTGSIAQPAPTSIAPTTSTATVPPPAPTIPPPTTVAPTTTVPPTTTTTAPVYRRGSTGPAVADLQATLRDHGYWIGPSGTADGTYDHLTAQAVMAFQKVNGLARDGVAGPQTLGALGSGTRPAPRHGGGPHIEIDLARQVLLFVRDGRVEWVFNTSTGRAGWRTPAGTFAIGRQIDGMRRAPLGNLWRPKYFNGGIAMHGSNSIPGHPASHGCARLSNAAIDYFWAAGLAPPGTAVIVY